MKGREAAGEVARMEKDTRRVDCMDSMIRQKGAALMEYGSAKGGFACYIPKCLWTLTVAAQSSTLIYDTMSIEH
jgi:hypothetical protein